MPTSDSSARASAGRIVDILQRLVLARPELIIPLEQVVHGILGDFGNCVETQMWQREDATRSGSRTPLPPMALSELPSLLALLEAPGAGSIRGQRAAAAGLKRGQRR